MLIAIIGRKNVGREIEKPKSGKLGSDGNFGKGGGNDTEMLGSWNVGIAIEKPKSGKLGSDGNFGKGGGNDTEMLGN